MNIVFRVDASDLIGHGHTMRCLTLANMLTKHGATCTFISRDHHGHLGEKIRHNGHQAVLLSNNPEVLAERNNYESWLGELPNIDAQQTIDAIEKTDVEWLVVDHYGISESWENTVAPFVNKVMVIDDLANRQYACNLLVDQTLDRSPDVYKSLVPEQCTVLCGTGFALLRPDFALLRQTSIRRRLNKFSNNVLLSLGGSDPDNFTLQVLEHLESSLYSANLDIDVVVGSNAQNLAAIKVFSKTSRAKIKTHFACDNIGELLQKTDLAIGAAGGSSWERACLGVPTIMLKMADNQSNIFETMIDMKSAVCINSLYELPDAMSTILKNAKMLTLRSSTIADGYGVNRVTDAMLGNHSNVAFSLRPVCEKDTVFIDELLGDRKTSRGISTTSPKHLSTNLFGADIACLIIHRLQRRCGCIIFRDKSDNNPAYIYIADNQDSVEAELFAFARIEEIYGDIPSYKILTELVSTNLDNSGNFGTLGLMQKQG